MDTQIKQFILEHKIIVIARRIYGENLLKLANALYDGGIKLIEVTFDQEDPDGVNKTTEAISQLASKMKGKMHIGAGTVLTIKQVDAAMAAGAKYIISPNTDTNVIQWTKEKGLVSIPGAMTPSEMMTAHNNGADFIKVFPVCDLGIKYMRNIMAPLSHLKFIATAGVNEENLSELLNIGFVGAGVGGRLTDKKLIKAGDFAKFTKRAKEFCRVTECCKKQSGNMSRTIF